MKNYSISIYTWHIKIVNVIAKDADEAVDLAIDNTEFEYGEEYEVTDIIRSELERTDAE